MANCLPGQKGSPVQCWMSVLEPWHSLPGGSVDGEGLVHVLVRCCSGGKDPSTVQVPKQGSQILQEDQPPWASEKIWNMTQQYYSAFPNNDSESLENVLVLGQAVPVSQSVTSRLLPSQNPMHLGGGSVQFLLLVLIPLSHVTEHGCHGPQLDHPPFSKTWKEEKRSNY